MIDKEVNFSPIGRRKLSLFAARGLTYRYLNNELDSERKNAFETALKDYPELVEELRQMTLGLNMTQKLQNISISEDLSENLKLTTDYVDSLKSKINFDKLPPALKLGIEGLFIALAVATLAIVIPWNSVMDMNLGPRKVILTEIVRNSETEGTDKNFQQEQPNFEYPDDAGIQKVAETASSAVTAGLVSGATVATVAKVDGTSPNLKSAIGANPNQLVKAAPPLESSDPTAKTSGKLPSTSTNQTQPPVLAAKVTEKTSSPSPAENKNGVLYRGTIYITNFKAITPKLVEKLQELGGRKAGQVELGWFKGESSYFHFTMPEGKYDELAAFFNTYGTLVIQKEPHERIMPDGIRRVIITVYEKK